MQQGCANLGPFADQYQDFSVPQSRSQRIDILDVIVPDRDVVA